MKCRLKPFNVDALQFLQGVNEAEIRQFCPMMASHETGEFLLQQGGYPQAVHSGDWVVKGLYGQYQAYPPEVFYARYELVDETPPPLPNH